MLMLYKKIIRPLLFTIDPERIHGIIAGGGEFVARIPLLGSLLKSYFRVSPERTRTEVFGTDFPHPLGLSAGFDKDARYVHFAEMIGFSFMEIGSVTGHAYEGNKKPRLRRLIKNQSLVVNYGLKSQGAKIVRQRLQGIHSAIPYGISIAKTNAPTCAGEAAVDDYAFVYKTFSDAGLYHVLNLSCPNTSDGILFSEPKALEKLLEKIIQLRMQLKIKKPLLIKIGPDVDGPQLDAVLGLIQKFKVDGIIIGNLLKDIIRARSYLPFPEEHDVTWKGGISGRAVQKASTELIKKVFKKTNGKLTIIGCGGIYTAQDAYDKIRAGSTLLQMITGFIYGGPTTIRKIAVGLDMLLKRDGFTSIKDARGVDAQ